MASLKEIRVRIGSVNSTYKITSAMKMVSSAKLHQAQDKTLQTVPYKNKLTEVLARYLGSIDDENFRVSLSVERDVKRVALIAISSSTGLCGAFNSNINKLLNKTVAEKTAKGQQIVIIPIGKKVADHVKSNFTGKDGIEIDYTYLHLCEKPDYATASEVAATLTQKFVGCEFDRVELLYNHFKNAGVQVPTVDQFLPLPTINTEAGNSSRLYFVEPDAKAFVENLVPIVVRMMFYATLLDSSTAEFGARTTAMQIASDNAQTLLAEITQLYNRARQEVITNELIDIVGGSEALRN